MASAVKFEMKLRPADYQTEKLFIAWTTELYKYLAFIQFKVRFQGAILKMVEIAGSTGIMPDYTDSKDFALLGMQIAEFLFKLNPKFEVYRHVDESTGDIELQLRQNLRSMGTEYFKVYPFRNRLNQFYYGVAWNIFHPSSTLLTHVDFVEHSLERMSDFIIAMYLSLQTKPTATASKK